MSKREREKKNKTKKNTERHGRLSEFSERWNEDIERNSEEIVYSKVKERETDLEKAREKNVEKREFEMERKRKNGKRKNETKKKKRQKRYIDNHKRKKPPPPPNTPIVNLTLISSCNDTTHSLSLFLFLLFLDCCYDTQKK